MRSFLIPVPSISWRDPSTGRSNSPPTSVLGTKNGTGWPTVSGLVSDVTTPPTADALPTRSATVQTARKNQQAATCWPRIAAVDGTLSARLGAILAVSGSKRHSIRNAGVMTTETGRREKRCTVRRSRDLYSAVNTILYLEFFLVMTACLIEAPSDSLYQLLSSIVYCWELLPWTQKIYDVWTEHNKRPSLQEILHITRRDSRQACQRGGLFSGAQLPVQVVLIKHDRDPELFQDNRDKSRTDQLRCEIWC